MASVRGRRGKKRRPRTGPLRGDNGADRPDELRLRNGTNDLLLHPTLLEQDEVRDAADAVAGRRAGILVGVHLDDLQPAAYSRAISSTTGARARRGAHQGAQQSIRTVGLCSTSRSNESST